LKTAGNLLKNSGGPVENSRESAKKQQGTCYKTAGDLLKNSRCFIKDLRFNKSLSKFF